MHVCETPDFNLRFRLLALSLCGAPSRSFMFGTLSTSFEYRWQNVYPSGTGPLPFLADSHNVVELGPGSGFLSSLVLTRIYHMQKDSNSTSTS